MQRCISRRKRKKGVVLQLTVKYYSFSISVQLLRWSSSTYSTEASSLNVVGQVLGLEVHHEGVVLGHFSLHEVGIDAGTLGEE